MIRERTNTAGDLGSPKDRLKEEFSSLSTQIDKLPDCFWQSHSKDWKEGEWKGKKPYKIRMESKKKTQKRAEIFREKLHKEMEEKDWKRVAVVLHSKLFSALFPSHKKIKNAEVIVFKWDEFFN